MADLPRWVWDLVADLLDEEDLHPKLYAEMYVMSAGKHEMVQYDWCPSKPLARVPDSVKVTARAIAGYRHDSEAERVIAEQIGVEIEDKSITEKEARDAQA